MLVVTGEPREDAKIDITLAEFMGVRETLQSCIMVLITIGYKQKRHSQPPLRMIPLLRSMKVLQCSACPYGKILSPSLIPTTNNQMASGR